MPKLVAMLVHTQFGEKFDASVDVIETVIENDSTPTMIKGPRMDTLAGTGTLLDLAIWDLASHPGIHNRVSNRASLDIEKRCHKRSSSQHCSPL